MRRCVPLLLLPLLACSPAVILNPGELPDAGGEAPPTDGGAPPADAGPGEADAGPAPPPDAGPVVQTGLLAITNVSNTPGTISHDGVLVLDEDGVLRVAFAEPDAEVLSDQEIHVGAFDGETWSHAPETANTIQFAFPNLFAGSGAVHLAYSGVPGGDSDIFYARDVGGGFGTAVDLTSPGEGGSPLIDSAPRMLPSRVGDVALLYSSRPSGGTFSVIKMMHLQAGQALGAPFELFAIADGTCEDATGVMDIDEITHVIARCSGQGLMYATDQSGLFASAAIGVGAAANGSDPVTALDVDGRTVHVAFTFSEPCPAGTCRKIYYARLTAGVLNTPVRVSTSVNDREFSPSIAVTPSGRVLIAYHRFLEGSSDGDVILHASVGGAFSALNLTADIGDQSQTSATAITVDADDVVHVIFQQLVDGAATTDTEVFDATIRLVF